MKKILIVKHEYQRGRPGLLIDALSRVWRRWGLQVCCLYGTRTLPSADLVIPQIDLTRTPLDYLDYLNLYSNVANRKAVDLSKRRVSRQLVQSAAEHSGPVIVKTNTNYGGLPEHRLLRSRKPLLALLQLGGLPLAERLFKQEYAWRTVLRSYPVFPNATCVPACAFQNPALVVERFVPERERHRYFLRHYLFLGDRTRNVRVAGTVPFLKRAQCVSVEEGLPVPEEVLQARRELGLDYGKIDYVVHEGRVLVLDVNRTPGTPGKASATARTVGDLAEGIWALLDRSWA